jgi:hypothetical protein
VIGLSASLKRKAGFAFVMLLLLCGTRAHADEIDAARIALAAGTPVALIGVPSAFLQGALDPDDEGMIETQSDWATYLVEWSRSVEPKVKVVVLPIEELKSEIEIAAATTAECITLFIRKPADALLFDHGCVVTPDVYDFATEWYERRIRAEDAPAALVPTTIRFRRAEAG